MEQYKTPDSYEEHLVCIMSEENVSLSEALFIDFFSADIDHNNVFDTVEYLEQKMNSDMTKVQYYMEVYTGDAPDVMLRKVE